MPTPRRTSRRLTLAAAKTYLRTLDVILTKKDGEYRVNFRGGDEATACYTDDIEDAVGTGRHMAAERAGSLPPRQRRPGPVLS